MAAAASVPVAVMETAGEGGAWGIAVLAAYMAGKEPEETLEHFLETKVFAESKPEVAEPEEGDIKGFDDFIACYKMGLAAERAAVDSVKMTGER